MVSLRHASLGGITRELNTRLPGSAVPVAQALDAERGGAIEPPSHVTPPARDSSARLREEIVCRRPAR
jgi:hypothetical protein